MVPDPNENPVTQPADDFIEAEGRRAALEGATAPEPPVGEPDRPPRPGGANPPPPQAEKPVAGSTAKSAYRDVLNIIGNSPGDPSETLRRVVARCTMGAGEG
jgi:hypothetical protein